MEWLKSMKHYFFLDKGDFFVHFFDFSEEMLELSSWNVPIEKMKSLLQLSIRTSSANSDPFKDDVTCDFIPYSLTEQIFAMQNIRGALGQNAYILNTNQSKNNSSSNLQSSNMGNYKSIESISFDYTVNYPLSLVICRWSITKYQLIFRHLIFCKYVERHLANTWLLHQSTKELKLDKYYM